jgi:lysophospholipase L1-like esterase
MKKSAKKSLWALSLTLLYALLLQVGNSQTINIQPLGNSITQGENTRESYRYRLWKKLIDDGFDFQFAGSMTDHFGCGTPVFDDHFGQVFNKNHEGHWGWRAYQILNGGGTSWFCRGNQKLSVWLSSYTPDISLIHLGTNDIFNNDFGLSEDALMDTTIYFLKSIIDVLRTDNPNVTIFLAQLIPGNPISGNGYRVPILNDRIPDIAIDKYDPNSPIIIVDQYSDFNVSSDTYDNIHPNESGEEKMAQKWRDAIFNHFGGFTLDLTVYLEGPFNGSVMNTDLSAHIPVSQPFNTEPWNYPGLETVDQIPAGVVDWILVEIRDAVNAGSADETTIVGRRAAFLRSDGKIVYLDGTEGIRFVKNISNDLFVSVHHRNHLPVLTASALIETSGVYPYDFLLSGAHGGPNAMKNVNGNLVMIAGDMDANGQIDLDDLALIWSTEVGATGYLSSDVNLDGQTDNRDKNDFLIINLGLTSYIP